MGKHRRGSPAATLVTRQARWRVPCRDAGGHRASLDVSVTGTGVLVAVSGRDPVVLRDLAVGRLRGALRAAAISAGLPAITGPTTAANPPGRAGARRRVLLCALPGRAGVAG